MKIIFKLAFSHLFFIVIFCFYLKNTASGQKIDYILTEKCDTVTPESLVFPEKSKSENSNSNSLKNTEINSASKNNSKIKPTKRVIVRDVETQKFSFEPNAEIVVNGKAGTKIEIPAGALVFADGTAPTSPLTVELKEYYDMADIVLAGLSTTSDGKLLETGGMLYISAFSDGKELQIAEGLSFSCEFPNVGNKGDMQMFYADAEANETTNWELIEPRKESYRFVVLEKGVKNSSEIFFNVDENSPSSGGVDKFSIDFDGNYNDNSGGFRDYLSVNLRWTDTEIKELSKLSASNSAMYFYSVDEKKKVRFETIQGLNNEFDSKLEKLTTDYVKNAGEERNFISCMLFLPPRDFETWSMFPLDRIDSLLTIKSKKDGITTRFSAKQEYLWNRTSIFSETTNVDSVFAAVFLQGNSLGWINCDRFIRSERQLADLEIPLKGKGASVQLIFPKINSVMYGNISERKAEFRNVPIDEPVILYATRETSGKREFAFANGRADAISGKALNFKVLSEAELKAKMKEYLP